MRRMHVVAKVLLVALLGWVGGPALAWGPMTHMAINELAWEQAAREMGSGLCVTPDLRDEFIGGGPCPDIKFTAGASFPLEFHTSPEVAVRLIALAKQEPWGKADVAMALGWAGHIFAEVWTAHTEDGYPNRKITLPVPNPAGLNHQVNELVTDLLAYRERARAQRKVGLAIPARLLEKAMADEAARGGKGGTMRADQIRWAGHTFIKTVSGVRVIAEYLLRERPDLLDEMDDFHADRQADLDESVARVVSLLREHGRADFRKTRAASLDERDGFFAAPVQTSLTQKARDFFQHWLGKALHSDTDTTIFTVLGYGVVKGALATPFLRGRFLDLARAMGTASVWGNPRHKQVLSRYVEGLLVREDLTYPEIIAYAMEGIQPDPQALARQREQFKKAGLTATGRKPVTIAQVAAAWQEVERIEAMRREWPWFWPFRPGPARTAAAREKAGRLLAYYFEDHPHLGVSPARVAALLSADRGLRRALMEYKQVAWYNPVDWWQKRETLRQASDAFLTQERSFAETFQIIQQIAAGGVALERLTADTRRRLQETEASLAAVRAQLARAPAWNLLLRQELQSEAARLQRGADELRQRLEVLEALAATPTTTAESTATSTAEALQRQVEPEVDLPAGLTLEQAQQSYQAAYATYQRLTQRPGAAEHEVRDAATELARARQRRDALQRRLRPAR
ncbi:MAG: hypothetical protein OZSIB_2914 [Candidatus Ozemobacter sibiricus]|uniref:Phospholipase C/D domain-containing protein n=1 Tax=Candidatus Ozemobacter sibiricus TaxID=2268124 RepID=A0A367ZTC9_9BACT|nr:MAG: hypothetical protein OZSIB_2914 [Candidatus Ozemobacter sibiricus]